MTPGFAMLCRKAWRESRGRFTIAALVIGGVCIALLGFHELFRSRLVALGGEPTSYAAYAYVRIYGGVARSFFVILVILLGLGGLARERTQRTLGFSLALPVRRIDHLAARALVGLVEVAALAALPALLVPVCSAVVGEQYPIGQCAMFALLWFMVGAAVFAASVVVSVVVPSEYAALAVAMVILRVAPLMLAGLPGVGRWPVQLDRLMSGRGMSYFDSAALVLTSIPWSVVAGAAAVTAALLAIAARATARESLA